jgi:hypothetical protein
VTPAWPYPAQPLLRGLYGCGRELLLARHRCWALNAAVENSSNDTTKKGRQRMRTTRCQQTQTRKCSWGSHCTLSSPSISIVRHHGQLGLSSLDVL